jgi:hypothetical protein
VNPQQALEDLAAQKEMFLALAEQIKPIEAELTIYRAVFMALKAQNPALFQSGGQYDLDQLFAAAGASPAIRKLIEKRSEEVSSQIESAALAKQLLLTQLKQPIGSSFPKGGE